MSSRSRDRKMPMLSDISSELPTNGLKVSDLVTSLNERLRLVSTALTQLDAKTDRLEGKVDKKFDLQDRKLDDLAAVQARAPTRADLAELQKEQMRRETYEIAHKSLETMVVDNRKETAIVRTEVDALTARLEKNLNSGSDIYQNMRMQVQNHGDRLDTIEDQLKNAPSSRRSNMALWLTGIGIGLSCLCSGTAIVVAIVTALLRGIGH